MRTKKQELVSFCFDRIESLNQKLADLERKKVAAFFASIPALIMQNGLLSTFLFFEEKASKRQNEKKKRHDEEKSNESLRYQEALEAFREWAAKERLIDLKSIDEKKLSVFQLNDDQKMIKYLAQKIGSNEYAQIQSEALRFFEAYKLVAKALFGESENAEF